MKPDNGNYKLGIEARLSRLETIVVEIKDNHLKHISDKLDNITMNFVNRDEWKVHLDRDEDHETRIRFLEKTIWRYIGAASILAFFGSLLANTIIERFLR